MPASVIKTCKLHKNEPQNHLKDVLTSIVNGHKQKNVNQLLRWNFKCSSNAYIKSVGGGDEVWTCRGLMPLL
jgi:hypothetical protein